MVIPKPHSPLRLCLEITWRGLQRIQSATDGELKGKQGPEFSQPELGLDPAADYGGGAWEKVGGPAPNPDGQALSQP